MTHKEYKRTTAREMIRARLSASEAAARRRVGDTIESFCRHVAEQQKKGRRWPFDFIPDKKEMDLLVDYLFQLRAGVSPEWMRGPWVEHKSGERVRTQLPNSSDNEPMNFGEQFTLLLRKYWMLVFGFTKPNSRTGLAGIGRTIFEANAIDNLDVGLLLRKKSPEETLEDVAADLEPSVREVNRSNSPTDNRANARIVSSQKKQAETVRQRVRDLDKPRRK